MVINKKIKRTMLERKSQYIGSFILIVISCMVFTLLSQMAGDMQKISDSFARDYVQEDASFIADQKLNDTAGLESRFDMKIEESSSFDYQVSNGKTLRVFSQNTKVDIPAILEGKSLSEGKILIDPAYAKANGLKLGDAVSINGRAFEISGFMSLPNYIYPLKNENDLLSDPKAFGIAVLSKADYAAMNQGQGFYSIKFNRASDKAAEIARFKDYLKGTGIIILRWTDAGDNARIIYVNAKIEGQQKLSSTLPVLILILTCILTGIVMWRMLKMESVQIRTLYALGYRKSDIMKHYLAYPFTIALSGGIIGTLLGAASLKPMVEVMVAFFSMPVKSIDFSIGYVLASVLLPVVFLCICSYFVINRILAYSPVELMRGGKEKGKVGFLEKRLRLDRLKFNAKFKTREQLRSIPRSIFLLLGVILATMFLLLGFTAKSSLDYLMKDTFESAYKYQYQYVFNSLQHGTPSKGEAFSTSPFMLKSDSKVSFPVIGVDPQSRYITFKDRAGNSLGMDKVIVTRPLADRLGIKTGDTIQAVNKLDSRSYSITAESIAETYVGEYIYMPLQQFNSMLKYPADSYMGLFSADKLDIPGSKLMSTATIQELKDAYDVLTQPLQYVVGVLSIFSFIIGLLVIYVVTSLIIEENKQNISLMKVLGYRRRELSSLILNSSTYLVVLGYILGVPILLATMSALFSSITANLNLVIPITINYAYVIVGFVVIYLTYELSKAMSRRKVDRVSMNEALKSALE